jgi:hypothetical protein
VENGGNGNGEIILTLDLQDDVNVTKNKRTDSSTGGTYNVRVYCEEAGDQDYSGPPLIDNDHPDNGNNWNFDSRYRLWVEVVEPVTED